MNKINYDPNKTFLYYFTAAVVFGTYGGRVCPMLETLTGLEILYHVGLIYSVLFIIRHIVSTHFNFLGMKNLVNLDVSLALLASLPFAAYYSISYDFPLDSNAKVIFGMALFGFLTGFILDLQAKIYSLDDTAASASIPSKDERRSMVTQAIVLVVLLLAFLTISLTMIGVKDVFWLENNPQKLLDGSGKISVIKEFVYVSVVLIAYSIYIMTIWSSLLKRIFAGHEEALIRVTSGEISSRLPVYSNDELGAVALMTNSMLDYLERSQEEIQVTRDAAIVGLAALAESRDNETGAHIIRTQEYVKILAIEISKHEKHQQQLTPHYIDLLYKSAPLHDVGKVGIPDSVLLKPGKLTDEEFDIMKGHPQIGADALSIAEDQLGNSSFLTVAREISLTHHEKWDGSGYPNKLSHDDIPIAGRLMALADVYDALISKRVYKPAFSHEKAKSIILEGSGSHFDPDVVDAFLAVESGFIKIADMYRDRSELEE
ncbi:HD-GYP domain-containing protein [Vibrio sp. WJH972]